MEKAQNVDQVDALVAIRSKDNKESFFEKQKKEFNAKLDVKKIAMHIALETGGVDLYKRAKQLNPT